MNWSVAIGPLSSIGCAERVHDAADQGFAHGNAHDAAGALDLVAFADLACTRPAAPRRTWSSSRFMAMPATSCGNSSSSPAMTLSRPWTRAMPSPEGDDSADFIHGDLDFVVLESAAGLVA